MAQNMVLSQPYLNAQFQNPALVGDGIYDQRIQSNLRTQMFANNNVSNTIVASWDSRFKNNNIDNNNNIRGNIIFSVLLTGRICCISILRSSSVVNARIIGG